MVALMSCEVTADVLDHASHRPSWRRVDNVTFLIDEGRSTKAFVKSKLGRRGHQGERNRVWTFLRKGADCVGRTMRFTRRSGCRPEESRAGRGRLTDFIDNKDFVLSRSSRLSKTRGSRYDQQAGSRSSHNSSMMHGAA